MATILMSPVKFVWGVPENILPVKTDLPGRQKISLRNKREGRIYFKTPDGIRKFVLVEEDGHWIPKIEQGRNIRP